MDEPFGQLDNFTRESLQAEMSKLWSRLGMTVLFVTHDVDEAIFLSDRVALFRRDPGRISSILTVDVPRPRWEFNVRADPRAIALREQIVAEVGERARVPAPKHLRSRRWTRAVSVLAPVAVLAILVGAWQITAHFVNPLLISSPHEVADDLGWLFTHQALWSALGTSLKEMIIGAAIGLTAGLCAGVAMSRFRSVHAVLSPFVNFFNATPLVVTIPLVIIWVGIGQQARLLFVFLITLWPILLNTVAGIRNVGLGYTEVGAAFGLTEGQILRRITIPGAAPYILAGARVSAGLAIIGMIVSEMEVSLTGLGNLLITYGNSFLTGKLLAVVFVASMFGVGNVLLLQRVQRTFFPWIAGVAAEQS
jgi:NitT/TauT family transport system permease protein